VLNLVDAELEFRTLSKEKETKAHNRTGKLGSISHDLEKMAKRENKIQRLVATKNEGKCLSWISSRMLHR